jgi:enoyl-CoA hydratase/carnithine racemase
MTATLDPVLVERTGAVALVRLNRAEVGNAINDAIRQGFAKILRDLDQDGSVKVILLRGAGERGFCVGADIKESRGAMTAVEHRRRFMPASWIETLDQIAKPVIAAIHGFCLGGGLELALACDIRIAAQGAQFGLPETALGLIPGGGGTQRLPRLIGLAHALDLLLSGKRIDVQEAYRIGLVTFVAQSVEAMDTEALRLATLIASRPPTAIAYVKEAARAGLDMDLTGGLKLEKSLFALLTSTADSAEAAAAFREKRTPKFTGT